MRLAMSQASSFVKRFHTSLAIFVVAIFLTLQSVAVTQGLPSGWESYLDRPDILSMKAKRLQYTGLDWQQLKHAHFSFIAFLLETYPANTKIYFLARDSEYLYDVARLVTQGTPDANRFHLLNVSRGNMRDPLIAPYLKQNGISEENLLKGQKILFVDTGFAGTIPRVVAEVFPDALREKLITHLLVSSNPAHPSSRTFLFHLNPIVNTIKPQDMHGSIVSYEHMSRFTDRSSTYYEVDGVIHPISLIGEAIDGEVNRDKSVAIMRDLVASWALPQLKRTFEFERKRTRRLQRALQDGSAESSEQIMRDLNGQDKTLALLTESQVRDIIDAQKNTLLPIKLNLQDLGLKVIAGPQKSKKNDLIKQFPEWAPVLEDPSSKIPFLFKTENWQMIANLIDADVDSEINKLLRIHLYDGPAKGMKKNLQKMWFEKEQTDNLSFYVLKDIIEGKRVAEMADIVDLALSKTQSFYGIARIIFEHLDPNEFPEILKLVVERADPEALKELLKETFPDVEKSMPDLMRIAIERGSYDMMARLRALSHIRWKWPVLADAVQIKDDKERKRFLDKNYDPLKPGRYTCNSFYRR